MFFCVKIWIRATTTKNFEDWREINRCFFVYKLILKIEGNFNASLTLDVVYNVCILFRKVFILNIFEFYEEKKQSIYTYIFLVWRNAKIYYNYDDQCIQKFFYFEKGEKKREIMFLYLHNWILWMSVSESRMYWITIRELESNKIDR